MSVRGPTAGWMACGLSAALFFLAHPDVSAAADERRWRMFDQGMEVFLAVADKDSTLFDVLPQFSCRKAMGFIDVHGEAKENLRLAMAEFIRTGQEPQIRFVPDHGVQATVDVYFAYPGWEYKYTVIASHEAFERFKLEGVLEFRLSTALVREEFTTGLDDVGKFLDLCRGGMQ